MCGVDKHRLSKETERATLNPERPSRNEGGPHVHTLMLMARVKWYKQKISHCTEHEKQLLILCDSSVAHLQHCSQQKVRTSPVRLSFFGEYPMATTPCNARAREADHCDQSWYPGARRLLPLPDSRSNLR